MVGNLAPDFTAQTADGESFTLTDYVDREGDKRPSRRAQLLGLVVRSLPHGNARL